MILTRAGRRKAGLSPLLSLLNGNTKTTPSNLEVELNKVRRAACKSACTNESSSSSDENEEGTRSSKRKKLWVQCDHVHCGKWRMLPNDTKIDTKSEWYCSMHPDPSLRSCDLVEEKWGRCCKQRYVFSELEVGQLVWAKMQGFSPWPAIITPDPWSDSNHIDKVKEGTIYHVEFLGKHRTHLWITEEKVEPYNRTKCSLSSVNGKATGFVLALQEADSLCILSNEDKLKTCVYTDDFAKVQPNSIKKEDGYNTSVSTKTKKHHRHKVPSIPDDVLLEELSALKKILSSGNTFDFQAYIQYKHELGLTGKAVPLADLTNVQTVKKKRGRKPKKCINLDSQDSHDSFQPRRRKENTKNLPSFEDKQVQLRGGKIPSACRMSNGRLKDHSAIVCPSKFCGQSIPPSMKEILEGEEEARKEFEMIENMLSLVQEGSGVVSAKEEQEVQEDVGEERNMTEKEESVEETKNEQLEEKEGNRWVGDLFGGIEELDDLIRGLDQASRTSKINS